MIITIQREEPRLKRLDEFIPNLTTHHYTTICIHLLISPNSYNLSAYLYLPREILVILNDKLKPIPREAMAFEYLS